MGEPAPNIEADRYEEATDHPIETCKGDARSAVKSLLIVIEYPEHELELAKAATSRFAAGRAINVQRLEHHKNQDAIVIDGRHRRDDHDRMRRARAAIS